MSIRRGEIEAGVTWQLEWHACATSTNDIARNASIASGSHLIIVADYQTHGRGQHGRRWVAPAGENLLASFCIAEPRCLRGGLRSMAAALSVRNVLELNGIEASLKWPNDVVIRNGKIAGVLVESKPHRLIIGIGLNVHWPPKRMMVDAQYAWTSMLAETGHSFCREAILKQLASEIACWFRRDASTVLDAYRTHWITRNSHVQVRVEGDWIAGIVDDLNHDASIRVITRDGVARAIYSSADLRQGTGERILPESAVMPYS